jgi:hypothetical protein
MHEIIDRITTLLALATSANEYEASAAAAKAQEILTEHNLKLEDIKTSQKSPALPIEQITIGSNSRKVYWRGFIANAIANANFCKMWWMGGRMVIAGGRHNVALALSLYDYLTKTVERLADEGVKSEKQLWQIYLDQIEGTGIETLEQPNWRRWKSSFITGCSGRLLERIEEQTQRMNSQGIPNTKVTGLACRMAHEREQEVIARWRQEQGITLTGRKATSKARLTKDGYIAGQRAGDFINLERQLSSASSQLLR